MLNRLQLHLNFEVFNALNHVANTAVNTLAYEAHNLVLRPVPNLGQGVASQGYPDGTNARRAQVSARLMWEGLPPNSWIRSNSSRLLRYFSISRRTSAVSQPG